MKSREIRKAFLDYFSERGHEVVRSSSLIPRNDPTLLFTNAGMVQFKSVFQGAETRPYKRAATCQKSMRAGGKHSDLENVGHTKRHHTFFEMLGNFSFGDYFKREAMGFAWELLTKRFGLQKDKLWVTVYEEDDEAEKLWRDEIGVPKNRIVRLGAKDNFWQMGDTGPCGPCSEIIIDQGEKAGCGKPDCRVGCDCDRFLELWNLVFMQYDRDSGGKLTPLPKPSIDTGMGLERISAVMQGKLNNFDSDAFSAIIDGITSATGVKYGRSDAADISIRVLADHVRASAFLLSDGLMPANDGRGYVLRRIIRRASRHARLLNASDPVLYRVLDAVVDGFGDVYPELIEERERAAKVLKVEEERFSRTLEQGMRILDSILDGLRASGGKVIPGGEVFKLYDTFGFPLDLARDIALDAGFTLDEPGFNKAMESQRERARASWVGEEQAVASIYREVLAECGGTEFLGYDALSCESVVKAIIKDGHVINEVKEGASCEVVLDKTPFYAESGGQLGDTGSMRAEGLVLEVLDVKKPVEGLFVHKVKVKRGVLRVWAKAHSDVNEESRRATMRNHTATHLLQAALRSVLGEHVRQAGSLVGPDRLRFDFTHFSQVNAEETAMIEEIVNSKILDNLQVVTDVMAADDAVASGAMALFGEKYGEHVRVVNVGEFSRELCGGTHCKATGEIGVFRIDSESSVASGIRRIEAVTGKAALKRMSDDWVELKSISSMLKTSERPSLRLSEMLERMKDLEREMNKAKGAALKDVAKDVMDSVAAVNGVNVISKKVEGLGEQKDLRELADNVRDKIGSGVIVLAAVDGEQASVIAMVTKDLTSKFKAGAILKSVMDLCGGRGGGKPDMAQGGTKDIGKLDSALSSVYDIIRKHG